MVRHIVFFKLSPGILPENRNAQLKKMEEIFSPLGKKLTYIVEFKTGINFTKAPHAWDFVIDSEFKNKEDLERYQRSKEHQEAVGKGSEINKTKAVVDYEF